jgi:hypothetical protein
MFIRYLYEEEEICSCLFIPLSLSRTSCLYRGHPKASKILNSFRKESAERSAKPAELTVSFTAADSVAPGYAPLPPRAGLHTPLLSRHSQVVYLFHSPPRILSPMDMRHFPLEPVYVLPSSPATPR